MADLVIELAGAGGGRSCPVSVNELSRAQEIMRRDLGAIHDLAQATTPPAGGGIFQTLLGFLGDGLGVLSDVVGFPLNLIGSGADYVIKAVADLAKNVPIVGSLISDILLAANTLLQVGLKLPSSTLSMVQTLLKSFNGLSGDKQKSLQDQSMEKLLGKAKESGQEGDLQQLFNQSKKDAATVSTEGILKKAAGVGVPLAVGTGAFFILQGLLGTAGGAGVGGVLALLTGYGAYELGAFD